MVAILIEQTLKTEKMELPKFKYSSNAFELDIFENVEGTCSVCNEKRQIKYTSSFYSVDEPEYICPWCIADGKVAASVCPPSQSPETLAVILQKYCINGIRV
ncbi:hypothetical protein ASG21_17065 [Chryseobacterium sp. Leaf394]|nr:hypothetical protein ASG21_17065 [Chryseobacterium sp. Leaf394]